MSAAPPLGKVAFTILSLSLVAVATWQRSSHRLTAALAWIAGLAIFWIVASMIDVGANGDKERAAVGPPLGSNLERILLVMVVLLAAAFRFVLLDQVPPILVNDEAMFVGEGAWRPEFPEAYGWKLAESWPSAWFPYLFGIGWNSFTTFSYFAHWSPVTVLGISNWSLRCGSALIGTSSVIVMYVWTRRWWGSAVAVGAALALALNTEHLYWSRIALNNIDAVLVGTLVLASLAWALDTRRGHAWVALGYALGAGFYTYHGAKLFMPLTAFVLLVLIGGRWERFSRRDLAGALAAFVAFCLIIAPLVPDILADWPRWYGDHAGRLTLARLYESLSRGDSASAWAYLRGNARESVLLIRPAPVMSLLVVLGTVVAVWKWRDSRYLTALLWMVALLVIGSATTGWRSARLIGAAPLVSLMPALFVGHARAAFVRRAPRWLRLSGAALGVLLATAVIYESWWVQFVWRGFFRNETFGLCQVMQGVPLPATFLVAGKPNPLTPQEVLPICALVPDERRRFIAVAHEPVALPEMGDDPEVVALIFANRPDFLARVLQDHPAAVAEPYYVHGIDPYAGKVPSLSYLGRDGPGSLSFNAVRLRSATPGEPLLSVYEPSDPTAGWMGLSLPRLPIVRTRSAVR
jgi:4-amino-4-deoxy-L-arabinose transferase-like glycosyltransferase